MCPSVFFVPMKEVAFEVGERIRVLRDRRDWLQRELAAAAGLPLRTIGRIERGEVDVRLSTLTKIADALGVPLKALMP
jgi:transcriptional regulator with XRE-family HTH domain